MFDASFLVVLIDEAAPSLGIHEIVSFDEGFDGIEGMKRIKSPNDIA